MPRQQNKLVLLLFLLFSQSKFLKELQLLLQEHRESVLVLTAAKALSCCLLKLSLEVVCHNKVLHLLDLESFPTEVKA